MFAGGSNKNLKWLVALSGGADSVALLLMLKEQSYTDLHALHCNFGLRGAESDRDERFCRDLCQKLGIDLHVKYFDTKNEAAQHHESIEMAARRLRYEWFNYMATKLGAEGIFVAHHQDDQAETVLMNLVRGTGLQGLKGMAADSVQNGLRIVRPLLGMSKVEILDYLSRCGQDFITDSSNLEREALRNRIRLDVIPLLRQLNPKVTECISRTAENLQSETEDPLAAALFHQLSGLGFNRRQIMDINTHIGTASSGLVWESASHIASIDRGSLLIAEKTDSVLPQIVTEEVASVSDSAALPYSPDCAFIDADTIKGVLSIRKIRTGDRFCPYGMNGRTKLISDYLTDRKVPLLDKQRQLVVTDGTSIIWLVGHTTDNRHCVTAKTDRIIKISVK